MLSLVIMVTNKETGFVAITSIDGFTELHLVRAAEKDIRLTMESESLSLKFVSVFKGHIVK